MTASAAIRAVAVLRDRLYTARNKAKVHLFSGLAPYYIVNEFPKSGGTWLAQMLAELLGLPFPRHSLVRFEPSLVHGHYLRPGLLRNVVVLWRDPRDVIVSFYHHCYFVSEFGDVMFGNRQLVSLMKERCPFADYDDVGGNLPEFIRFISTTPVAPRYTWVDFAKVWASRPGTLQTSYEALRADCAGELTRLVHDLTGSVLAPERAAEVAERHSFARAKARAEANLAPGTEKSFVRQGSVGGWRDSFSDEACAMLDRFGYTAQLRRLGYAD
ncbi:MAG: sulfotransferase domain-containing protein [Sphingomonadales bacterium]|nr:sulfotransferase domain-containing protein [Sphingomonadales bacterium]MDE2567940.1 sulfotransferase domain-containing protein [Sphingomonadales bacterium]